MQATVQQPQRAPDGAPVHCERHRREQITLYRLVQPHAATFFPEAEAAAGADLPQFVKDQFEAFLECSILAHDSSRRRRGGELKVIAATCGVGPDANGSEDRPCLANAKASVPWQPVIEKIPTHLGSQARAPPRSAARGQALQVA